VTSAATGSPTAGGSASAATGSPAAGGSAPAAGSGVLVVGYGNPLRSDDGVGPAVAARLAGDPRLAGAEVRSAHQLTPELALDASGASLLVLVDAAADVPAGEVSVSCLDPEMVAVASGEAMTHHLDPAGLVGLARELWGAAPQVVLVSVGVSSLEVGDRLSPVVEGAVEVAADAVVAVVEAASAEAHGRA
jgi:hydrogenase maturation protease